MSRLVSLPGGCLPGHRACAFVLCFCVMCIALFYIVCISMVVRDERAFAMSDLFSNPLSAVVFSYGFNVPLEGQSRFPTLGRPLYCVSPATLANLVMCCFGLLPRLPATLENKLCIVCVSFRVSVCVRVFSFIPATQLRYVSTYFLTSIVADVFARNLYLVVVFSARVAIDLVNSI